MSHKTKKSKKQTKEQNELRSWTKSNNLTDYYEIFQELAENAKTIAHMDKHQSDETIHKLNHPSIYHTSTYKYTTDKVIVINTPKICQYPIYQH